MCYSLQGGGTGKPLEDPSFHPRPQSGHPSEQQPKTAIFKEREQKIVLSRAVYPALKYFLGFRAPTGAAGTGYVVVCLVAI